LRNVRGGLSDEPPLLLLLFLPMLSNAHDDHPA